MPPGRIMDPKEVGCVAWTDRQRETPVGWCPWCGRELYAGAEVRLLHGGPVHEECLEEYVEETFPRRVLER